MTEAVIVSGVRTAIGNYGGALRDVPVVKLGSLVIKEALKRAGLRPKRDPEVLNYAPEVLKDIGLIELEKKYYDWDDAMYLNHEIRVYKDSQTGENYLEFIITDFIMRNDCC